MQAVVEIPNKTTRRINQFKEQEIITSTPEKCVVHLYDLAIQNCSMRNELRASKAVAALADALDFEKGGEIAQRLYVLYDFCIREIHANNFEDTKKILVDLRSTWQQAMKVQFASTAA